MNIFGLLVQIVALVVNVLNMWIVFIGLYPNMYVTPYTTLQALMVMLNAFFQAFNFIIASLLFIYNIASKLGVSNRELASQLVMKYALLDYVILAGYKLYTCFGLILLLKNNKIPTNVTLVATTDPLLSTWYPCGELQCTSIQVPLNHSTHYPLIDIHLVKYPALESPSIPLIFNPGGPGGSGIDMVESNYKYFRTIFGNNVELIGFDPRGVGKTSPIKCGSTFESYDLQKSRYTFDGIYTPPANATKQQIGLYNAISQGFSSDCAKYSADIIDYLSTANAARDMDYIRDFLGVEELNYYGASYGSFLGLTYANMFPNRVGKIILDGVTSPFEYQGDIITFTRGMHRDYYATLEKFYEECDKSEYDCPLYKKGNRLVNAGHKTKDAVEEFLKRVELEPIGYFNGMYTKFATSSMIKSILGSRTYRPREWPLFAKVLLDLMNNSAELFLTMFYPDESTCQQEFLKENSEYSHLGVACSDTDIKTTNYTLEEWVQIVNSESFVNTDSLYYFLRCRTWKRNPDSERYDGPWNTKFKNQILLIGNTFDPATPYSSAVQVQGLVNQGHNEPQAVLLTLNGYGHVSLSQSSKCINNHVKRFIADGKLPPKDSQCYPDNPIFSGMKLLQTDELEIAQSNIHSKLPF
ncbi:hypothetical protein HDV06_003540 [Boothiomyces sp. JEL0866]|nr:hypothetical protein HDV06_003540 [Boothiomyces sp. JEL0866]